MPNEIAVINEHTIPRCPIHNIPLKVTAINIKRREIDIYTSCKKKREHISDLIFRYKLDIIDLS